MHVAFAATTIFCFQEHDGVASQMVNSDPGLAMKIYHSFGPPQSMNGSSIWASDAGHGPPEVAHVRSSSCIPPGYFGMLRVLVSAFGTVLHALELSLADVAQCGSKSHTRPRVVVSVRHENRHRPSKGHSALGDFARSNAAFMTR
jgi:hypothetical protein